MRKGKKLSTEGGRSLQEQGLSLRKIGQIADIHPSEVTRIKAGEREWRTSQLIAIAKYLKLPVGGLLHLALTGIEDRSPWKKKVCRLVDELNAELLESLHPDARSQNAA
jgi:hypothetical protein